MKKQIPILFILFLILPELLPAQAISSLAPNSGNAGQTLTVSITGNNTHFSSGSSTVNADFEFSQGSSSISNINVLSWTNFDAEVSIPPLATTGYYDLYCSNTFDGDLHTDRAFYVNGTPPRFTISPTGANPGQTLTITITGSNTHFSSASPSAYIDMDFVQGSATTALFGILSIANDTLMAAQFAIPAVITPAYYTVHLNNGWDGHMIAPNSLAIPSTLGINENINNELTLSAFPNPYADRVILTAELKKSSPLEIEIFTSGGKKVFEKIFENISRGKFSFEFSATAFNLADDVYLLKCKAGTTTSVIKLIHMK